MVISLQLALKTSPLTGLLAKLQSKDSQATQDVSFGEVLKAKEKQLQQEQAVSAASIAAALAAMQTKNLAIPTTGTQPKTSAGDGIVQSETRPSVQLVSTSPATSTLPLTPSSVNQAKTGPETTSTSPQPAGTQANTLTLLAEIPLSAENAGKTDGSAATAPVTLSQPETVPVSAKTKPSISATLKPAFRSLPGQVDTSAPKITAANAKAVAAQPSIPTDHPTEKVVTQIETVKVSNVAPQIIENSITTQQPRKPVTALNGSYSAPTDINTPVDAKTVVGITQKETQNAEDTKAPDSQLTRSAPKASSEQVVETKLSGTESEASIAPDINAGGNAKSVEYRPVVQVIETQTQNLQPAPEVITMQVGTNQEKVVLETKPVEAQTSLNAVPSKEDQPASDIRPTLVEINQEKSGFDTKRVEIQISAEVPVVEVSQTTPETIATAMISPDIRTNMEIAESTEQAVISTEAPALLQAQPALAETSSDKVVLDAKVPPSEAKKAEIPVSAEVPPATDVNIEHAEGLAQTSMQSGAPAVPPTQDLAELLPAQSITSDEKINVGMGQLVKQVSTTEAASEVSPAETDNGKKAKTPGIVKMVRDVSISAEAGPIAPVQPAPEAKSVQVGTAQEKSVIESKVVETKTSVNPPAVATSQIAVKNDETTQDTSAVETGIGTNSQNVVSADFNQKLESVLSANKPDAAGESPASVLPASQKSAPVAFALDDSGKAQTGQETLKTGQAKPASEKTHPAEKLQEIDRGTETTTAAPQPARETVGLKTVGKDPAIQVNTQAADVAQQIARHLNARVQNGPTSMHLLLNPKELGAIEIQMDSSAQGVSITFSAEQPGTEHLLETQMNQLRQSLTEAGIQISGLNIGQHGQPRQEGGFLNQNPHFSQTPQREAVPRQIDIAENLHSERIRAQAGEVDYFV